MKVRKRRTSKEICIFIGLFLVIFVTIFHILLFSHTRAVAYYDSNNSAASSSHANNKPISLSSQGQRYHHPPHQHPHHHAHASGAENVARRTLSELLTPGAMHDDDANNNNNIHHLQQHLQQQQHPAAVVSAVSRVETVRKTPIHHHPIRHGVIASSSKAKMRALAQAELRKMEKSLTALVRQNAPSPEVSANKYRSETSALRLKQIINQTEERLLSHETEENNTKATFVRQVYYSSNNETGPIAKSLSNFTSVTTTTSEEIVNDTGLRFKSSSEQQQQQQQQHQQQIQQQYNSNNNNNNNSRVKNPVAVLKSLHHFKDLGTPETNELTKTILDSLEESPDDVGLGQNSDRSTWDKPDHDLNLTRAVYVEDRSNGPRTQCPPVPAHLEGVTRDVHLDIEVDIDKITQAHVDIGAGGEWKPSHCVSRHRLAIIIPYRDRWSHLKVLLYYLLPVLKRQQIHFRIFVVEQYGNQTFNKGRIMNAAYREALKLFDFHCVTFHDVDLVPEDDRNIYTCAEHPKHMSTAIDKFNYHLPYQGLVGGVLSFRVDHFQLVNGYSNMYWGWGGEDDDMTNRILSKGLRIFRPPNNVARYKMVKHNGRPSSQIRLKLLRTAARRGRVEGLNNVPYHLLFTHLEKLFTHFMVDVGEP